MSLLERICDGSNGGSERLHGFDKGAVSLGDFGLSDRMLKGAR